MSSTRPVARPSPFDATELSLSSPSSYRSTSPSEALTLSTSSDSTPRPTEGRRVSRSRRGVRVGSFSKGSEEDCLRIREDAGESATCTESTAACYR